MSIPGTLDAILILLMLAFFSYGWVVGFARSAFAMAGIAVGAIVAFFAIPMIGSWITWPEWRLSLILIAVAALVAAGLTLGSLIGQAISRHVEESSIGWLDRLGGALLNAIAAALIAFMVSFSISPLGVPFLTQAIAGSSVLRTIEHITPAPIRSGMAQLRSAVVDDGIPRILSAAGEVDDPAAPTVAPTIPNVKTATPPLDVAAKSVVKITGAAIQCGQNQSGSGFVVAKNRIVTNAHVVAGVTEPVIEVPGVGAFSGRVVYFDPKYDLAVISVSGMPTAPIPLGTTLTEGSEVVFDGYPMGGPFHSASARVERVIEVNLYDIYGKNAHTMEVYQLAANVQSGNSGGPLLSTSGEAIGVIFAKATTVENVGYAHTMKELSPVAKSAASFTAPVSTGSCIQH
ncbi:MAG: MarP family serine protease [Terrimesophilobacter sp.]